MLVNAIAYPAAAGSATEVLLDAIRTGHPDAPAKEGNRSRSAMAGENIPRRSSSSALPAAAATRPEMSSISSPARLKRSWGRTAARARSGRLAPPFPAAIARRLSFPPLGFLRASALELLWSFVPNPTLRNCPVACRRFWERRRVYGRGSWNDFFELISTRKSLSSQFWKMLICRKWQLADFPASDWCRLYPFGASCISAKVWPSGLPRRT